MLYCRQFINKMFPLSPSVLAVCLKTALLHLCSLTFSSHLRVHHFSVLLQCFHLRCATKRKPRFVQWSIKDKRNEKGRTQAYFFPFLPAFLLRVCMRCLVNKTPRRARLLECHSEWTQELLGLLLSPDFQGKLVKMCFMPLTPQRFSPFSFVLCFYFENM